MASVEALELPGLSKQARQDVVGTLVQGPTQCDDS